MAYQPLAAPAINDPIAQELLRYISRELQRVADAMQESEQFVPFTVLHVEPKKLKEGMLVFADGTNWDPGSGRGLYLYNDGAWGQVYATV
jgi:hypothetical protein